MFRPSFVVLCVLLSAAVAAAAPSGDLPEYTPDASADRASIPELYKWNLEDLYPSDEDWSTSFASAEVELAGLEEHVTPHTFRRSCTTELIRGNANLYHVKELLGHASLSTLKPYTRLTITDLKKTHARCHPRERDER